MTWVAVSIGASVVVGASQAYSGGKAANEQAASQAQLAQVEIDESKKALGSLGPARGSKMKVAEEEFKFGLEGLSTQTGIAKEDLASQMGAAVSKSGLAVSGTIEGKKSKMWKRIQGAFSRGQEGLMGQLGKAMGGVEEWYEGEKSKIEGVIKRATLQKENYEEQSDSWYLGKNIGEAFSDRELKKDIKYVGTLENNLNVYEFQYVWGGPRRTGIMADEVEKLYPEAVTTHPNGFQSVDYTLIT